MAASPRILVTLDFTVTHGRGIFHGISTHAQSHGQWDLVLADPAVLERPAPAPIRGIIAHVASSRTAELIRQSGIPAVNTSNVLLETGLMRVSSDDRAVGAMVADYYLARGFERFAFMPIRGHGYSDLRQEGFEQRLLAAGAEQPSLPQGSSTTDLADWLGSLEPPVALMACNDRNARDVANICREIGRSVPQDIAIVGVDNDEIMCEGFQPPLSSVALSTRLIGFRAAQRLEELLRDGAPTVPQAPLLLPPRGVVTRLSSDHLAVDDPDVAAALRIIAASIRDGIDVRQVADEVGVSRRALERRFQKVLGRSPGAEIRRVQIQRAKDLLASTDLPMPQTAASAGFSSAKQLSETFTHQVGLPPTAYRRRFRH